MLPLFQSLDKMARGMSGAGNYRKSQQREQKQMQVLSRSFASST